MKKNGEYVGVDEKFIPDNEKYVDESILGSRDKNTQKTIGIGYLVFFFLLFAFAIGMMIFRISSFNKIENSGIDYMFEQHQCTERGWNVKSILNTVVTNNKTNNRIVTVVYKEYVATTEGEIFEIKQQIDDNIDYQISIGYDTKGKANKIDIVDIEKVQSASDFNFSYSYMQGTHRGADCRLDEIITNNKTNSKHIITVIYNEQTATTEDEIISIKRTLDDWTEYECSLDYDENGYINKVTIEDI